MLLSFGHVAFEKGEHIVGIFAIFKVVGDGDDVESIGPRFPYAQLGQDVPIGVEGVNVEVGLVDLVALDIGDDNLPAL